MNLIINHPFYFLTIIVSFVMVFVVRQIIKWDKHQHLHDKHTSKVSF
jgi:hypothetical protein